LQAKGTDVWWDLDAITLGAPLDESLRSAVGGARYLLLIATAAAGKSDYVRLEIEAAIRHGLRVVPILAERRMPEEFQPLVASAPAAFDPIVAATESERTGAAGSVLARLERTPSEQVEWIQSQTLYRSLRDLLGRARASHA
jgi:hypothetical protein